MAKNFQEIMAEARKEVPEVSAQQVNELLKNNGKSPVILDVRESDEWRQGHLEGALPLPRGFLEIKVEKVHYSVLVKVRSFFPTYGIFYFFQLKCT